MKPTRILSASGAALFSTVFLLAFAPSAHAITFPDLTYNVTLNLSQLAAIDPTGGPFSLDLQLVTGAGNQTNTVTLSNFVFTGGTATGVSFTNGNETGSVASSVVLTSLPTSNLSAQSDNEFAEAFSAGVTSISFKVDQTPNSENTTDTTAINEQFNAAILDDNLINVATTDPSGGNTLVSTPLASSDTAASVNLYTLATPEPRSGLLGLVAATGLMVGLLRRRFNRAA